MDFIVTFMSQYPVLASVFMVIGVLRAINKPLFAFLHSVADATPTQKDNEILEQVEKSKVYSYISFALDYFASVKMPVKNVAAKAP